MDVATAGDALVDDEDAGVARVVGHGDEHVRLLDGRGRGGGHGDEGGDAVEHLGASTSSAFDALREARHLSGGGPLPDGGGECGGRRRRPTVWR